MLIKGRGTNNFDKKWGNVDAIDHFWTQHMDSTVGEGRSNDKMNGGRTVCEVKNGGSVLRQRKKQEGSILRQRQNRRREHVQPNK